jgi:hypothetical protein
MMAEMAKAIGKPDESDYYEAIFTKIKRAFLTHYTPTKLASSKRIMPLMAMATAT